MRPGGLDRGRVLRLGHFVPVAMADLLQAGRLVDPVRRRGPVPAVDPLQGNDLGRRGVGRLLVVILGVRRLGLVLV